MTDFCTIVNVGLESVSFIFLINESIMSKNGGHIARKVEILKSHSATQLIKKTHTHTHC